MNSCFLFIWPISLMLMTSKTTWEAEHKSYKPVVVFKDGYSWGFLLIQDQTGPPEPSLTMSTS